MRITPYAGYLSDTGIHVTELSLSLSACEPDMVRFEASGFYDERDIDEMKEKLVLIGKAWDDPQCRDLLDQCKVILALKNDQ